MNATLSTGLGALLLASLGANAQQTITYTNGENRVTPIVLTGATNPTSLEIISGSSATQSGNITQSGGSYSIWKTGAGTLTLSGTNVYSGGTIVRRGLLQITGSITDSGNALYVGELNGETGALSILNGGTVSSALGTLGHAAGSIGSALITGAGSEWSTTNNGLPFLIGRNGVGTLTLSSGGRLTVFGGDGEVRLGAVNSAGGTLNFGAPIGSAASAPGVVNASEIHGGSGSGAKTVVFNHTNTDYFLTKTGAAGGANVPLTNSPIGSLAVTHASGTTTLRAASTYSGGTTITGGRLFTTNAAGFGTGAITFNGADATLGYRANITLANSVVLQSHGKFEVLADNFSTHAGIINEIDGSFGITKTGPGRLVLTGANTYSGGTTLSAGSLAIGHDSALGTGSLHVNTPDASLEALAPVSAANPIVLQHSLRISIAGDSGGSLTLSGNISESVDAESPTRIVIRDSDDGGVRLSGMNTHTGGTVVESGRLIVSSDASLGAPTAQLQLLNDSTLVVTDNTTSTRPIAFGEPGESAAYVALEVAEGKTFSSSATLSADASGSLSFFQLVKTGAGTFIANGVSSIAEDSRLEIQEGTFVTTGPLGGRVTVANGATLQLGNGGAMPAIPTFLVEEGVNFRLVFDHNEEAFVVEESLPYEATLVLASTGSTTLPNGGGFQNLEVRSGTLVIGNDASVASLLVEPSAMVVISNDDLDVTVGVVNGQLVLGGPLTTDPQRASFWETLTLGSTSTVVMELNGLDPFAFSRIVSDGGSLTFGGTLSIEFGDDYLPQDGDTFHLFQEFDSSTGTFSQIVFSDSAFIGNFDYATGVLTVVAVPEPSTYALAFAGLLALLCVTHRKQPRRKSETSP